MSRSSLGGLSASQANARTSGPTRISKDEKSRKSFGSGVGTASRPSLSGNLSGRRLSHGTTGGGAPRRKSGAFGKTSSFVRSDPRPISDKSFQAACIRNVIAYLTEHGYDRSLSPKMMSSPTSKEFSHMVYFLFNQLDPNGKYTGKPEEEIPATFKRIGYPAQISKSAMSAVGSPHTWPALLAALAWLVELLTYEERALASREDALQAENSNWAFFNYVGRSYGYFLIGNDAACEELDEELAQSFRDKDQETLTDIQRLEQGNLALEGEIEELCKAASPLEACKANKAQFTSDIQKFNKVISGLQDHKAAHEKKLAERQEDLACKQAELESVRNNVESLRERVAVQEVRPAEFEHMSQEVRHLEGLHAALQEQKVKVDRQLWDKEAQVAKAALGLEERVRDYHQKAHTLQVLPVSAKRAGDVDYEVRVSSAESHREGGSGPVLVGSDLKGVIRPALQALREQYAQRTRQLQEQILALQAQHQTAQETLAEKEEARAGAEGAVRRMETAYQAERERTEAALAKAAGQADQLEDEVINKKSAFKDVLLEKEAELKTMQMELEKQSERQMQEKIEAQQAVLTALDVLMVHKQQVQDAITRVKNVTSEHLIAMKQD